MSVAAMTWVLKNSEAQLGARLVMIAIADEADAEGRNAWPSIARIAHHSRLSIRNVRRLLAKLEKGGELLIHPGTGRHGVHIYTLPGVSSSRPGGGSPNPAPPPAPDPRWRQKYTRKPASRGDATSSPIEPETGYSRDDGAPSPRGDNLAGLPGMTISPPGDDRSSSQGMTLRHPTQEQTREEDPKPPPDPPTAAASGPAAQAHGQETSLGPLPDWIPKNAWEHYIEMREFIRKPMTPRAILLAIKALDLLMSRGNPPEAVLNQSILNSWPGLYGVDDGRAVRSAERQRRNLDAIEEGVRRANR